MAINLLGLFDDFGGKLKNMVILTTVMTFINYCVDNTLQPSIDELVKFVKEKTGYEVASGPLEVLLDILLNNINLFVVFSISESCEDLARDMLDNPSAIRSAMRRFV